MYDSIDLGPVPADEACRQLGRNYNPQLARQEFRAYINQLRRHFGEEPPGAMLRISSNSHDFGSYLEVICRYHDNVPAAVDYAFACEANSPTCWDDAARAELGREVSADAAL